VATKTFKYPPLVIVSGNETMLEVAVQNAYLSLGANTKGVLKLLTFQVAGNTITFSWNGKTVVFTCPVIYHGTANTYPARAGAETLQEWGERGFHAIASNYLLSNDFIITGESFPSDYQIYFVPLVKEAAYNLTISSTGTVEVTNSSYSPNVLYENYKLQLQVLEEIIENYIIELRKTRSAVYIPFGYENLAASLKYDLSRLIYSDITGHFTFPEDGVRHVQDIIQKYYLQLSFIADNLDAESLVLDKYFYVLPGKISQTKEKAFNTLDSSLYEDLISTKRFLTFAPIVKTTDIYAPEKLYFLFRSAYATATLKITERFVADNAETRDLAQFSAAAYSLHEFSIGFQTIKQADYGTKILSEYDIWIENGSGALLSERRTFRMDYTYQRTARYFYFQNSFGMYELFRSTGDAIKANKVEKTFYDRVIHGKTDRDQTRKPIDIRQTYMMKVNSGFLEDPWNFYYASEFLGSGDVYWLKNDRPYAVQVEAIEVDVAKTDLDNIHDFDFSITLDDMDDGFYQEFMPGSELPISGDFNDDFSDDFNV
jgi:hypothetical protein